MQGIWIFVYVQCDASSRPGEGKELLKALWPLGRQVGDG